MSASVGEQLKRARLALKFSLPDVTKATKIQPWVLEALEADQLDATMSPIYVKGFLSSYARFLRLDPNALIAQLFPPSHDPSTPPAALLRKAKHAGVAQDSAPRASQEALRAMPVGLHELVASATAAASPTAASATAQPAPPSNAAVSPRQVKRGFLARRPDQTVMSWGVELNRRGRRRFWSVAIGVAGLAVLVMANPLRWTVSRLPSHEASLTMGARRLAPSETVLTLQPTNPLELSVIARRPTWISVKADGQLLTQQQLRGGSQECWRARRRFELIVAAPSQVEVSLNGQPISPLAMAHHGRLLITHSSIKPLSETSP
jgi:hypothetical protein